LNGFLLGRYDAGGPQRTLYAPAPLWRPGRNDIVILDLQHLGYQIEIREQPALHSVE
jgi:beta-galactosidase